MDQRHYHLVRVVQKIGVFQGFELDDIQRLLKLASVKNYDEGSTIYARGEPSQELLVLLKGKLFVKGESGEELATIGIGKAVGEMGVFTGKARSANVEAAVDSTALVLGKSEIKRLIAANKELHSKVLENVVRVLSERLEAANALNESNARIIRDLQKEETGENE